MEKQNRRSQKERSGGRQSAVQLASWAPASSQVPRLMKSLTQEARIFRKVLAHNGLVATASTGFVVPQAITGSNAVTSAASWTTVSATALEYRVVALELFFFPVINAQTGLTLPPPAFLAVSAYSSGLSPGTFDQIAEAPGAKFVDGHKPFRFAVGAKGLPDALMYTPTNASIVASSSFGVQISDQGSAPAGPVSTTIYKWVCQYLVEFRSLD
jgi:hypothetical protein